jgi:YhcN/YlaJ family sporulation lipoprotein
VKNLKNNKIAIFLTIVLAFVFTATGCQTKTPQRPNVRNERIENRVGTNQKRNITQNKVGNNRIDSNLNNDVRNRDMVKTDRNLNMTDRAEKIARNVAKLKEVNSATCVITGNTALIGIDMKDNIEGKMTNDLKRKVESSVRNTDKNIKNVTVTADVDLYKRISNMARDIRNGRPITGFTDEIQEMLRRITPSK